MESARPGSSALPPAIAAAIEEGLSDLGIAEITRTPITAPYVLELIGGLQHGPQRIKSDRNARASIACMTQPAPTSLSPLDQHLLRRAIELSAAAMAKGNMAFGALLADPDGNVLLEAENTTFTEQNALRHAETNLVEEAVASLAPQQIAGATLYTSCEPCAMCSGAMYWAGINRMVYAMSEHDLLDITGVNDHCPTMRGIGCRNILETGQRNIEVSGPHLVEEASAVQHDYFGTPGPEGS